MRSTVQGRSREQLLEREEDAVRRNGHSFDRVTKRMAVEVTNFRKEMADVRIRVGLGGEVTRASEGAQVILGEPRRDDWQQQNLFGHALNPHSEVMWELALEPGETRTVELDFVLYVALSRGPGEASHRRERAGWSRPRRRSSARPSADFLARNPKRGACVCLATTPLSGAGGGRGRGSPSGERSAHAPGAGYTLIETLMVVRHSQHRGPDDVLRDLRGDARLRAHRSCHRRFLPGALGRRAPAPGHPRHGGSPPRSRS